MNVWVHALNVRRSQNLNRDTLQENQRLRRHGSGSSGCADLDGGSLFRVWLESTIVHVIRIPGASEISGTLTLNDTMLGVALLFLSIAGVKILLAFRKNSISVLTSTFHWSEIAVVGWWLAALFSLGVFQIAPAWQDQFWYWAAVLTCCPLISVLGAKRPTSTVWPWFIILPLIAVLGWPALTIFMVPSPDLVPLEIQSPVLIGFVLVLVMGTGNYMGSRFGVSILMISAAAFLSLWPVYSSFTGDLNSATRIRAFAALLCGIGVLHGFRQASRPTLDESKYDQLWFDFRDAFGIVWSIRIQDRINQTAEQEKWVVRLGTEGFVWEENVSAEQIRQSEERLTYTLHWLLRRFVEPEWINARLQQPTHAESIE